MNNSCKYHWLAASFSVLIIALLASGCARSKGPAAGTEGKEAGTAPAAAKAGEPSVSVSIELPESYSVTFGQIPCAEGMTVFDCMEAIRHHPLGPPMEIKGSGDTAFLVKIEDTGNGANGGSAWIYYVNGEQAKESFGIKKVNPGDTILWKFEDYR